MIFVVQHSGFYKALPMAFSLTDLRGKNVESLLAAYEVLTEDAEEDGWSVDIDRGSINQWPLSPSWRHDVKSQTARLIINGILQLDSSDESNDHPTEYIYI